MNRPALRLVKPLDQRLAETFEREEALVAELAQVRDEINADRALWMKRERTFGISREALRKAVSR